MSGTDRQAWLASRRPVPPDGLRAHLAAAAGGDGVAPEALARTGVALLRRVVTAPAAGRELALDLLAADAFVTYAFEAQAEVDPQGLGALADRLARGGDLD
jgi:hypothetical protein